MKNKKLILIISIIIVLIIIVGSSYAFWIWESDRGNDTNVSFTTQGKNFSCSADGGGNITSADVLLEPAKCSDTSHAIVREIHTNIVNNTSDSLRLDLWLNINSLDTELANSPNFKWAITDSNAGCDKGNILGTGIFKMRTSGDKQMISQKVYSSSSTDTYYLYIWLDEEETDIITAGKSFNMSLGGECSDVGSNMPNKPYINNSGLVPVKLSDSGDTVTAISEDNPDWYDYYNKKWANAVLVDSTNRSNYQNLTGNTEVNIPTSEILAYYVWIPRYSYKVWQYSGISEVNNEQEIDIRFVGKGVKEKATENGEYYTHPAFTFGDTELSGIWVGKFETSHTTLSSNTTANNLGCTEASCSNYAGIRVLPNVLPLYNNNVSNFFYASRFMETDSNSFGLNKDNVDSHMMKNSEWGAPAYLSHSRYGINGEVEINGNKRDGGKTGCAGPEGYNCFKLYGTEGTGIYPQSTTGNVTGVFDMAGGANELVMGNYDDIIANAGFVTMPENKYYDKYSKAVFNMSKQEQNIPLCTLTTCGGHALNETLSWYTNRISFFSSTDNRYAWILRGRYSSAHPKPGIFVFNAEGGGTGTGASFRLVLVEE